MNRRLVVLFCVLISTISLWGCSTVPQGAGWTTLIDGSKGLDNWNLIGDANWRSESNAIVADKGAGGFMVSKNSYQDFTIYAEFWAATDTNSGIFIRTSDPKKIGADNSYEVNIWDIRPDPSYGTGAIVNFAKVPVPITNRVGGQWNTMEVVAKGSQITVKLNGTTTASLSNDKYSGGPFALQYGLGVNNAQGGPIKWRKVMIKEN